MQDALRAAYRVGVRALRVVLRWLPRRTRPGITIVTVSYESLDYLRTTLDAIRRFSPPDVRVLVIDNNSHDGTRRWLKSAAVPSVCLRTNLGHGFGLDLGFLMARTEFVVALDVDAFPISDRWLDVVCEPLSRGAALVGAQDGRYERPVAHPMFLAMRQSTFRSRPCTFEADLAPAHLGIAGNAPGQYDTGVALSFQLAPVVTLPRTSVRGPGIIGSVFGDVVYHNGYSTRVRKRHGDPLVDGLVALDEPEKAWQEAVAKYLS